MQSLLLSLVGTVKFVQFSQKIVESVVNSILWIYPMSYREIMKE